jgi:predicted nucleic acid-binding Zn ribbon protein
MTTWKPARQSRSEMEPKRVGESLDRVTKRIGAPTSSVLAAVFSRWEAVVGSEVAAHAKPSSLRDGVLVIVVDQPAWATQLKYLSADLLSRIEAATGRSEVSRIHIKVSGEAVSRRSRNIPN